VLTMTIENVDDFVPTKTPRREAREKYARFLLKRAGIDDDNAETFMTTKQEVLYDESPISLIYTGRYERAIEAVETFTEDLVEEYYWI
jgi:hypothetical protein